MEAERDDQKEKSVEKRQRAVPKFGSFKPRQAVEPGLETRPVSEGSRGRNDNAGGAEKDRDREDGLRGSRGRREQERHRDSYRRGEREHRHSSHERDRHRRQGRVEEHERERERDRHRHQERVGGRERDRDHERERGRERRLDLERHSSRSDTKRPPSRDKDRKDTSLNNDLFVFDKHGDPLILQYGTNDRSKVPAYYRSGGGRIIGSPGFLTIHRDTAQEQFSIRGPGEGSGSGSAFRDKALVAAAARFTSRRIKPLSDPPQTSTTDDYIPLGPSRKRKRDDDDETSPGASPPDYRSIHGKAKPSHPDSDSNSDSDSPSRPSRSPSPSLDPTPKPELSTTKTRAIALTSHLKSQPHDIPAWLELIALQDTLFAENNPSSSSGLGGSRTAEERHALAELRLAFYQEALGHVPSSSSATGEDRNRDRDRERDVEREKLVLGLMREGARVWGEDVLVKKWDELISGKGGVGGFGLWKGRVDFEMGRVNGFSLEGVRGLLVGKMDELMGILRTGDGIGGEGGREELCGQVVYMFLRLTRLLQDAGFGELAVAAWQAVLEMTLCRPAGDFTAETAVASLAEFWESEVARIGEEGARGWRQFVAAGEDMADPPEARSDQPAEIPRTADPFEAWAVVEQQAAAKARMPARTLDEGTEDDPFRVVMFSDIKDLLVWFPPAVLPLARPMLVDALLVFCGLPPAGLSGEKFAALLDDPFVAGKGQGLDLGLHKDDPGPTLDLSRREPDFNQQGGSMAISPELLFSGKPWFRYLDRWSSSHPGDGPVDIAWVLGALGYLVRDCGVEEAAEYYLAMEWLNEPAGARKVAKGLLKQYSSSIRLYNAYALLEWANEKPDVSHKVLSSATGLALPTSSGSQLLWNTWAWIHLAFGEKQMALARLCSSVDKDAQGSTVSVALLLKTRSHFSSTRDYSLSSQQLETAVQYAESLMLLKYLAVEAGNEPASDAQGNIAAALESVQSFSRELATRHLSASKHHERLLQSAARLLYHHATHGPYRPTTLRAHLEPLIALFPRNALFLALYAWCQPPLRLNDPVRGILHSLSLRDPHDSLATRRLAIRHEARVGTAHSVRAAFEAALVDSYVCRGSVELWTAYVRFCCTHKELRGRAREVFYRAVAACPWARGVYMLAFGEGLSRRVLGGAELRGVVEGMVAKGLRVHVDLGEFLEGWERGDA